MKHAFLALVMTATSLVVGFALSHPLVAQTATTGAISGLITDGDGIPLDGVEVTLAREGEGATRTIVASREGRFLLSYLSPGEYTIILERFGFIPVHVTGVIVRSGRQAVLEPRLRETSPPVTETDRFTFAQVGGERARGGGRSSVRSQLQALPLPGYELSDVARLSSQAGTADGTFGLPQHLTGVVLDGLRIEPADHPRLGPGALELSALSPFFLQEAEFTPQSLSVALGGVPAASLRATSIRGGNDLQAEAFGNLFAGPLDRDGGLGASVDPVAAPEAGVLIRGPITPDTAHFAVGLQARQVTRPVSPLTGSSPAGRASLSEYLSDLALLGGSPEGLGPTRTEKWNALSTFGRLDWRLGAGHTLTLTSMVNTVRNGGDGDLAGIPLAPPEGMEASDVLLSGSTFSRLGERSALELRLGFHQSAREYDAGPGDVPGLGDGSTWIQDGGMTVGVEPAIPGRFESRTLRMSPTLYLSARSHELKLGMELASRTYTEELIGGPLAWSAYPSTAFLQQGHGVGVQVERPSREVDLGRSTLGVFLQDRWTPVENLSITAGIRADGELLPFADILPSEGWSSQTGIVRARGEETRGRFSPRVQVEWFPDPDRQWRVTGSGGLYHGEVHPGILAEVLADSGEVRVQRTLGPLGVGGDPELTSQGRRLSLIGPRFDAPRTQALDVGVSRSLGPGTSLEVELGYRHTDFLPRRRDLNRVPGRFGLDQFDRELFGEVTQVGGVVALRPGSDRRFSDFDVVSALEADGWSTWWGVTVGASHDDGGPLRLAGSYTFSQTEDNVPGSAHGWPVLVMGHPPAGPGRAQWEEGRSDLDVPHRANLSGTFRIMESPGIQLGALYSVHSGQPFTPGIRDLLHTRDPLSGAVGLSAGSGPPIAIPPGMDGVGSIASQWSCLNQMMGERAERNACRTNMVHDLNLRFGMDLQLGGGWQVALNIDALNLLDHGLVIPDPALFVVGGDRDLTLGPDGQVQLPVQVNEYFGEPLLRLSPGRGLRIGLQVRY